jgi:apolipoprotein N-acyltransferase
MLNPRPMIPVRSFLPAFALGAFSAFAFQPVGWWPLMIAAIALLCELVVRASSLRQSLLIGWGFGVGQFIVGLNWIATAFTFQAAMPAWLGWIAVVLLSLYLAVYPMLAAGLAWRFGRRSKLALVLALAGAWAITEWLRATVFTGFAWNPIGVTLVDTHVRGASSWIGTYGLSALVALAGGTIWLLARRQWKESTGVALVVLLTHFLPRPMLTEPAELKPIRIVQPNIGQQVKWMPGYERIAAAKLNRLSSLRDHRQELVFWPEAAVTEPLSDNRPGAATYIVQDRAEAAREIGQRDLLLTGGIAFRSSNRRQVDGAANSIFVLGPGGTFVGRYDKAHLVPYGEYLPFRPVLSAIGLSRLAPGDLDFQAGPGPQSLALPEGWGTAGFQLCYEIIFSGHVVDRNHRPDFIFNPSNDAWFGYWGPPQHLAQARLRAAEEGLPVIRSTPTGISALVDARGEIIDSIPLGKAGIIWGYLPPSAAPTLFARLGNIIPLTLGFLLLIAAIALDRRARYRRI